MHFTSFSTYLYNKNPFSNSFNQFNSVLDWASNTRKSRGSEEKSPDLGFPQCGLRVGFWKAEGLFCKRYTAKGYPAI
jgi:hypothetical protein